MRCAISCPPRAFGAFFVVRPARPAKVSAFSGENPTGAEDRDPVAWMAERRETDALKPIDESCHGQRSESAGRNTSECIVAS